MTVSLQRAPRLKIRVVTPEGKPATGVKFFGNQSPFKEPSEGYFAPIKQTADGQFEILVRNPAAPVWVAFLDSANGLGAYAEFKVKQSGNATQEVRLAPLVSAAARSQVFGVGW